MSAPASAEERVSVPLGWREQRANLLARIAELKKQRDQARFERDGVRTALRRQIVHTLQLAERLQGKA